jgi:ribosomal protein S18 acetylase RimI-like enzyme
MADRPCSAAPRYQIRLATLADVDFLAEVTIEATRAQGRLPDDFDEQQWREGFGIWTRDQIHGKIPDSTTSVIELDSEPVGRLRVIRGERIELAGIQLLPRVQRRGIGTAVIEDLKREATRAGVPFDIGVEKDNPDARRLYERLGFTKTGESEGEYQLQWRP